MWRKEQWNELSPERLKGDVATEKHTCIKSILIESKRNDGTDKSMNKKTSLAAHKWTNTERGKKRIFAWIFLSRRSVLCCVEWVSEYVSMSSHFIRHKFFAPLFFLSTLRSLLRRTFSCHHFRFGLHSFCISSATSWRDSSVDSLLEYELRSHWTIQCDRKTTKNERTTPNQRLTKRSEMFARKTTTFSPSINESVKKHTAKFTRDY